MEIVIDRTKNPLISVIMGILYQREDLTLLKKAIDSIILQTFSDFELLISYDGSNDVAKSYLSQCAEEDSRIKIISSNGKTGLPEKLNACLLEAKGKYIARMDDDDFSYPNRFAKQIAFLNRCPGIAFVGCNASLICNGKLIGQRILPKYPMVRDFFLTQPYIHPTLMFRREAIESVHGYSEEKSCKLCEDYDMLLRLYSKGYQGSNLQKILFDYSVPANTKGNRRMKHRWNEVLTRWKRFRELGVLPTAFPYVIKPIVVGLLPEPILAKIKLAKGNQSP